MSTHAPPHIMVPLGHVVVHEPLLQTWFGSQSLPHVPQFSWSVPVNTQSPLQSVSPGPQPDAHTPPLHTGLAGLVVQSSAQFPQWALSVSRSTQTLPQAV
jgi:hypothetical protein